LVGEARIMKASPDQVKADDWNSDDWNSDDWNSDDKAGTPNGPDVTADPDRYIRLFELAPIAYLSLGAESAGYCACGAIPPRAASVPCGLGILN
jgi:hypothetical protein